MRRATALGFDATGVATLEPNAHAPELERWLAADYAGTMSYLHRQAEKRKDPAAIMPGARCAVVTLSNYFHGAPPHGGGDRHPKVAQYAWSPDYHDVLGDRLVQLAAAIRLLAPGSNTRCYVDAGPVPERELAQRAGLGWIGKNMMLIHPEIGSFTFIGVVLTDADLAPDLPFDVDRRRMPSPNRTCSTPRGAFRISRSSTGGSSVKNSVGTWGVERGFSDAMSARTCVRGT